ncbi:SPFH domain-containing protein [Streptomyces incanus]
MTQGKPEVDEEDAAAIAAYDAALRDFTIELNRLHIAFGAPSYAAIVKASVRPKLTKAGINEALSGKRLPSVDALLEFVRVVTSPLPPPVDAPAARCRPELAEAWRTRWQEVKFAQRQAQAPWRRLRGTVRETLDEAYREAQAVRAAAHDEAARIVAEARRRAGAAEPAVGCSGELGKSAAFRLKDITAKERNAVAASGATPPFWFAVPEPTPMFSEGGGPKPIAELVPGSWYLAVERRGEDVLLAQCQDGRRGFVYEISGIQIE